MFKLNIIFLTIFSGSIFAAQAPQQSAAASAQEPQVRRICAHCASYSCAHIANPNPADSVTRLKFTTEQMSNGRIAPFFHFDNAADAVKALRDPVEFAKLKAVGDLVNKPQEK